ncbi:rhodanese-like domain-containing protein [Halobacillus litoralis]|uniref:rhodanese-like domain-containing protein n=1 Tax=Halobacillus litoralis TaxID=45668 RepID=UPI001CFD76FE|nr:rhodanese-like domain-containing protein [Halobacillus litoralis]WLR47185.1 rhodanese-like domain-containing protein [Halobacillus litoralis]
MVTLKHLSTSDLAEKMQNNEEKTLILDVRNSDEFNEGKIENSQVEVINEPYFHLLDDLQTLDGKLAKNQEIVVVCAKGNSSQMIAEMLDEEGYEDVYSLDGGMQAWSEHFER